MLTGERLQYLADLLPENVSWGDPLNALMLDQILAAHSAGAQGEPFSREKFEETCKEGVSIDVWRRLVEREGEGYASETIEDMWEGWKRCAKQGTHPQPMPQTDAARDVLETAAVWLHAAYDRPPQTPECKAMLRMIDAEIERLDRAKGE